MFLFWFFFSFPFLFDKFNLPFMYKKVLCLKQTVFKCFLCYFATSIQLVYSFIFADPDPGSLNAVDPADPTYWMKIIITKYFCILFFCLNPSNMFLLTLKQGCIFFRIHTPPPGVIIFDVIYFPLFSAQQIITSGENKWFSK